MTFSSASQESCAFCLLGLIFDAREHRFDVDIHAFVNTSCVPRHSFYLLKRDDSMLVIAGAFALSIVIHTTYI
jgi:hypothetical protein